MGIKLYRTYDRGSLPTDEELLSTFLPTVVTHPADLIRSVFRNDDDRIVSVVLIGSNVILRKEKSFAEREHSIMCSVESFRIQC